VRPVELVMDGPFPNPVSDEAWLCVTVPEHSLRDAQLQLIDASGRQVGDAFRPGEPGEIIFSWSTDGMPISWGTYFWHLCAGSVHIVRSMTVVR
jgi:hypothetical protein